MNPLGKIPKTIDDLLEYPASAASMTDAELERFLAPYFPATRPKTQLSAVEDKTARLEASLDDKESLLAAARALKAKRLEREAKEKAEANAPTIH